MFELSVQSVEPRDLPALADARDLYDGIDLAPCPFTTSELSALDTTGEMLVYVPHDISANEMCALWGIRSTIDFDADRLIRYAMLAEDHWFIASSSKTPELLGLSGVAARRVYEDDGLHGLDLRRYLAFAATYRHTYGDFPDRGYWTFLHSASYDRSGISIVGFDAHGMLSHHGWMRNFKAKFAGSRYAALAPRTEITQETASLQRASRGGGRGGLEGDMD